MKANPEWKRFWKKLQKREKPETRDQVQWERHFLQVMELESMAQQDL